MMRRMEGMVLVSTLLILLVVSLLLLSSMQQVWLFNKTLVGFERRHRNFYQLERIAQQMVNLPGRDKHCVRSGDLPNEVIRQLGIHQGCVVKSNDKEYWYSIEDLGVFPCLPVLIEEQKIASHHFRVTVVDSEHSAEVIQLRWITAGARQPCSGVEHVVMPGISSWRYLKSLSSMELGL